MITDLMGFFVKPFIIKINFKLTQNVFQDIPESLKLSKKRRKKRTLKAITVLKKEGGGPSTYDHDHRFNVFSNLPLPPELI